MELVDYMIDSLQEDRLLQRKSKDIKHDLQQVTVGFLKEDLKNVAEVVKAANYDKFIEYMVVEAMRYKMHELESIELGLKDSKLSQAQKQTLLVALGLEEEDQ